MKIFKVVRKKVPDPERDKMKTFYMDKPRVKSNNRTHN